jgi:GntR family transcriptional regulator/GntR family frlABCD operon transcriptional regulator
MAKDNKYKELYDELRKRIFKGEFLPGSILPSESVLRDTYHVTQPTIRHALDLLVKDRLIRKHHGKGSIVLSRDSGIGIINFEGHSVTSQNDDINIITTILKTPEIIEWPHKLNFPVNDKERAAKVIAIERLRTLNENVVFFEKLLIPDIEMNGFIKRNLNNTSLYGILNRYYNISIKSTQQKIRAIAAGKDIAALLKVKTGRPIIQLERKLETNREGFHIYSLLWANTNEYMLYSHS